MRASRLLSLQILLQLRGRMTCEALAAEFEVSVRTIYRDLDALSAAGVPIYAERGPGGGVALHEGYRTRLTGLTPTEAEALAVSGLGPAAFDLGVGPEAALARGKMLAAMSADAGARAQTVASRFHLDPAAWYSRAQPNDLLPQLAAAVWRDLICTIDYDSWERTVTREVEPLGVVLKGGVWYLVARVGEDLRTYRVASIRRLTVSGETFTRPPGFDLARHWAAASRAFEERLLSERARVRVSPAGVRLLRDVLPAASEAVDAAEPGPDGWVEAEIPVEETSAAARQLLRLAADIEVLEPAALREAIAAEALRILELYRG